MDSEDDRPRPEPVSDEREGGGGRAPRAAADGAAADGAEADGAAADGAEADGAAADGAAADGAAADGAAADGAELIADEPGPGEAAPGPGEATKGRDPLRFNSWMKRSATGAVMTGIAVGLQQALELPRQEPAFVIEASGEPDDPDRPIDLHFDPDSPADSVAIIRRPRDKGTPGEPSAPA